MPQDAEPGNSVREPLAELFAALESPLPAYAMQLVQQSETAQDLVQEAFVHLQADFDTVRQPRPWLYRTVHNLAANHHRKHRKIVPLVGREGDDGVPIEWPDEAPTPDQALQRLEAADQTRRGLETLDERSRHLIRLKFEEKHSYRSISELSGISIGNVGYIAIRSGGRLEVQLPSVPASLAKADWQSVAAALRDGVKDEEPNHLFRVVEPAFTLPLTVVRHEAALNEDARVQLQTLKQRQAVVGLNFLNRYGNAQQRGAAAEPQAAAPFQFGEKANYTQQQAKEIIDQTSSEDTAAFMRLADRLVRQQDAAVSKADAIRATLPVQGRSVTFTRALQVNAGPGAGLELGLNFDQLTTGRAPRFWPLVLVAMGAGLLWLIGRRLVRRESK